MVEAKMTINNPAGLHARPAAQFVKTASSFKSKVKVASASKTADGKSILSVMAMGVTKGTTVTVSVDGPDEKDCLAALKKLVDSNFGE